MKYIITGGGSGGHIYPALAVADEILKREPKAQITLVGSKRGLEKDIFNRTSYRSYYLPVGQLHSSVGRIKQIWSMIKMPYCILKSFYILFKHKPKAVFGVGGYASGPLGLASTALNIPTYIWEGNATPGLTNRLLGKLNTTPFLVFPEAAQFFKKNKAIMTGVPVRSALESGVQEAAVERSKFHVLFVGGSQGAKVFNEVLPELFQRQDSSLEGFHIVHQTGLKNFEKTKKAYGRLPKNIEVLAYLDPIKDYYLNADLVVSRSGAGAVNELSMLGKASLYVPFPKASDQHQLKNAQSLVNKSAALLLEEKDFNAERLLKELLSLKAKPDRVKELGEKAKEAMPKGAREKIAEVLLAHR